MSFLRNVAGLLATSVALVPIGIASNVILARWLSVEDRGLVSVATTFASTLLIIGQLGWPTAAVYRLRRIKSPPAAVATASLIGALLGAGLLLAACVALEPLLSARLLDGAPAQILFLALSTVPFQIAGAVLGGLARGIDRFALHNTYRIGSHLGSLCAIALVLMIGQGGVVEVLTAFVLVQAVGFVIFAGAVLRHTGLSLEGDLRELLDATRFGLKSYVQSLSGKVHEKVDIFMIAYLLSSPEHVAVYTIAASLVHRLQLVPDAVATAAYPQLAGLPQAQAARFACRVNRQSLVAVLVTGVAMAAAVPFIIPLLFGEQYRPSIVPSLILIPGVGLMAIYRVLARYFTALDRQQANIYTQLISLSANFGLNLVLIPRYGIQGAALASLASYGLEAILITAVFLWTSGCSARELFLVRGNDIAALWQRSSGLRARLRLR